MPQDYLDEYYQYLQEEDENEEEWEMEGINLKRLIECPYCTTKHEIDFAEDCEESSEERQMGSEITYNFNLEYECSICKRKFGIHGYICEYPVGAYNDQQIKIEEYEEED